MRFDGGVEAGVVGGGEAGALQGRGEGQLMSWENRQKETFWKEISYHLKQF